MPIEVIGLIAFTVYITIGVIFQTEPKADVVVALVLLVTAAIIFNTGREATANQLAMYSFFFLASGSVRLFIQYVREVH